MYTHQVFSEKDCGIFSQVTMRLIGAHTIIGITNGIIGMNGRPGAELDPPLVCPREFLPEGPQGDLRITSARTLKDSTMDQSRVPSTTITGIRNTSLR